MEWRARRIVWIVCVNYRQRREGGGGVQRVARRRSQSAFVLFLRGQPKAATCRKKQNPELDGSPSAP